MASKGDIVHAILVNDCCPLVFDVGADEVKIRDKIDELNTEPRKRLHVYYELFLTY